MSVADLERALDLVGIFVFALSGASLAARRGFDLVGVLTLALATGLGGGLVRDVLVGNPPVAFEEQTYLAVPLIATLLVWLAHSWVERFKRSVLLFDAAGLSVFSISGAMTAHVAGLGWAASTLVGTTTAVGGGVVRDVLAREVPAVFRSDSALYATPAAAGAAMTSTAAGIGVYGAGVAFGIAIATFTLRVLSLHFGWRAPAPLERR